MAYEQNLGVPVNMTYEDMCKQTSAILKNLQMFCPFMGDIMMQSLAITILKPDDFMMCSLVPTACATRRDIFVNPHYAARLTTEEFNFMLLHEAYHVILMHTLRGNDRGWDMDLLNLAADCIVNWNLIKDAKDFEEYLCPISPRDTFVCLVNGDVVDIQGRTFSQLDDLSHETMESLYEKLASKIAQQVKQQQQQQQSSQSSSQSQQQQSSQQSSQSQSNQQQSQQQSGQSDQDQNGQQQSSQQNNQQNDYDDDEDIICCPDFSEDEDSDNDDGGDEQNNDQSGQQNSQNSQSSRGTSSMSAFGDDDEDDGSEGDSDGDDDGDGQDSEGDEDNDSEDDADSNGDGDGDSDGGYEGDGQSDSQSGQQGQQGRGDSQSGQQGQGDSQSGQQRSLSQMIADFISELASRGVNRDLEVDVPDEMRRGTDPGQTMEEIEQELSDIIEQAMKSAGQGKGLAGLKGTFDIRRRKKANKKRIIDFAKYFRKFITETVSEETSYLTPEKKYLPFDMIMAGNGGYSENPSNFSVFIDTSGSISFEQVTNCLYTLFALVEEINAEIDLYLWSSNLYWVRFGINSENIDEALSKDDIESGGTEFREIYDYMQGNVENYMKGMEISGTSDESQKWLKSRIKNTTGIIVFTDGCFDLPDTPVGRIRKKLIFAITDEDIRYYGMDSSELRDMEKFGKVVSWDPNKILKG